MHLSVAIPGEGGDSGEPPGHLYSTATFTKPKLFNKKPTNAPPMGAKKCVPPSRKAQYFKRALFAIINFLFAITIHIRVNQELIKNK